MTRTHLLLAVTIAAGGAPTMAQAQARAFEIRNDGGSRIQFVSDAPLETITGVSSDVSGQLRVDPANLSAARGRVAVRVASLRTGIDLRDEHLRSDNWLDAQRHPEAVFEIVRIEGATSISPNQNVSLRVRGRFTIHGVTRDVVARARVRFMPITPEMRAAHVNGDVIVVQASFSISLGQFGVSVPAIVRLKVSDDIRVNVSLRAVAST